MNSGKPIFGGLPFLCETKIGAGAFAEVWKMKSMVKGGESRAVKVFAACSKDSFDNEKSIYAKLRADVPPRNVIAFYGDVCGNVGMEMVDGLMLSLAEKTLRQHVDEKGGKLEIGEAKDISRQILTGLKFVHDRDITHADLKVSNILLTTNPLCAKLSDFGSSFHGPSPADYIAGTIEYSSPEQTLQLKYGKPTDIWSSAIIIYKIFTGDCLIDVFAANDTQYTDAEVNNHIYGYDDNDMDEESEGGESEPEESVRESFDDEYNYFLILEHLVGKPPASTISEANMFYNCFGNLKYHPAVKKTSFENLIRANHKFDKQIVADLTSLLTVCLKYGPLKRATVDELLAHPLIK